jgi:hypothetical protein
MQNAYTLSSTTTTATMMAPVARSDVKQIVRRTVRDSIKLNTPVGELAEVSMELCDAYEVRFNFTPF